MGEDSAGVCHWVNRRPRPASRFRCGVSISPPNALHIAMLASSQTMNSTLGR